MKKRHQITFSNPIRIPNSITNSNPSLWFWDHIVVLTHATGYKLTSKRQYGLKTMSSGVS